MQHSLQVFRSLREIPRVHDMARRSERSGGRKFFKRWRGSNFHGIRTDACYLTRIPGPPRELAASVTRYRRPLASVTSWRGSTVEAQASFLNLYHRWHHPAVFPFSVLLRRWQPGTTVGCDIHCGVNQLHASTPSGCRWHCDHLHLFNLPHRSFSVTCSLFRVLSQYICY